MGESGPRDQEKNSLQMEKHEEANGACAQQASGVTLRRELGLFSAVNMILAVMIGSGIFVSPAPVLQYSGSVGMCLVVWIVCGIVSLMGALAFAELGTVVPRSGAEFAYIADAYSPLHIFWGPMPAFLYSWVMVPLIKPAEVAVITLTFAEYFSRPFLDYYCIRDEDTSRRVIKAVGLVALGIMTYINVMSVKLYVRVQNIFGSFKIIACLIVIGGGIYELCRGKTENLEKGFEGTSYNPRNIALAFYSGLWAYDGWNSVTTVTEEIKRPEVNIPRSISISVPIVTILYVFMNVAYMTVLTMPEMIDAPAVAVAFGEKILGPAAFLIPLGVALSTFGCALSVQFGVTRLCYVAAQEGVVLESLSYVHYKRLTPAPAVVLQGIVAFVFIAVGDIVELIEFASFLIWIGYGAAMGALLVLRRTKKDVHRPYRVPTAMVVFILLVSIYLSVTPIVMEPTFKYFFALVYLSMGMLVYYFLIFKHKQPKSLISKLTYLIQVLFEAVPPDSSRENL